MAEPTRIVGLIRQSKERESTLSPDSQRGGIMTYCDRTNMVPVAWEEELDVPGDAFRPGLERAIRMIEEGDADGLVVWKVDRLGREPEGIYSARGRIERAGGSLWFADEGFDLNSESGDYLLAMFAARAKAERRRIAANWQRATKAANERGVHQGDAFGYDRVKGQPLTVNAAEAEAVRTVFRMRGANASWADCCKALTAMGAQPKRGNAWTINSVKGIIANRVYLGEARQGSMVKADAHEPIVSMAMFQTANAVKGSAHAKTADYLLSGLCRCQGCRYRMRGQTTKRADKTYRTYGCRKRHGAGMCGNPASANADAIESYVVAQVFAHHDLLMEASAKDLDVEALNNAVADAEAEVRSFVSILSASAMPELLTDGLREREAKVIEARTNRDRALSILAPEGVPMLTRLRDEWATMDTDARQAALRGMIDYVVVHKTDGIVIVWRGQGQSLGPVPTTTGKLNEAMRSIIPFGWPILTAEGVAPHKL